MPKVLHHKRAPVGQGIYIGRPSEWGNPFTHKEGTLAEFKVASREEAIAAYERWLLAQPELVARAQRELRGHDLRCWCTPLACHGDVLLRVANGETVKTPDSDEAPALLSVDLETHLIQPGILAPPIVCGSMAGWHPGWSYHPGNEHDRQQPLMHRDREVHHAPGKFELLLSKTETLVMLIAAAENSNVIFVGANIAYDFGCVLAERPDLFPLIWKLYEDERVMDVQIAAALNAVADGRMRDGELYRRDGTQIQSGRYSLDECVREWLARKDAKSHDRWRLSYALLEDVPFDEWPWDAKQYPVDDAVNTLQVAEAQLGLRSVGNTNEYKPARNLHDLPSQCHAAFCIHLGAMWGLRTEKAAVDELDESVQKHLEELRAFAKGEGFMRPKTKKPGAELSKDTKKLKEAVFNAYKGLPPKTPSGDTSISRDALSDSGDPKLVRMADFGGWETFRRYLPTLHEAARGPLNVKPNVLLSTGRVSYEGLIQLMPRQGPKFRDAEGKWQPVLSVRGDPLTVRSCFVAREGHVWSSVDYAAIEMSTLAQVCLWTVGYSELADAINRGMDPHSILGADLIGIDYEKFFENKKKSPYAGYRQGGKAANFGFPGMMGGVKFVIAKKKEGESVCEWLYNDGRCGTGADCERVMEWDEEPLDMPLCKRCIEKAGEIRSKYLERWREIRPYWRWVMEEIQANDAVVQFVSERIRGAPHGPAAANTLFQGLAADGAKRAVRAMTREMYLRGEALAFACPEKVVEEIRGKFGSKLETPLFGSRLGLFAHDETLIEIPKSNGHDAAFRQRDVMVEQMKTCVPDVAVSAEPALMTRWYKQAEAVFENERLVPWEPKELKKVA